MDLAVTSYATGIAGLAAATFALLFGGGRLLNRMARQRPPFLATVANEPGERLRRRWQYLGQLRSLLLTPLLVFIIAAGTLILAEPPVPDAFTVTWRQVAVLAVTLAGAAALVVRALLITLERRRLGLRIAAAKAIAQALVRITGNRNRIFNDVRTGFGVIDHVIAGLHGIYAIMVYTRPARRNATVTVSGDTLDFGDERRNVSLAYARKLADRFSRECGKLLGNPPHVRLVVAVPGWEVTAQGAQDLLVANERNIGMLAGWRDQRDYLMNEDVDRLQQHLDEHCARPG